LSTNQNQRIAGFYHFRNIKEYTVQFSQNKESVNNS
jgi:hypothetical protein